MDRPLLRPYYPREPKYTRKRKLNDIPLEDRIEIRNTVGYLEYPNKPAILLFSNLINEPTSATQRKFYTLTQIDWEINITQFSPNDDVSSLTWCIAVLQQGEVITINQNNFRNYLEDGSTNTAALLAYEPFSPDTKVCEQGAGYCMKGSIYRKSGTMKGIWQLTNNSKVVAYLQSPDGQPLKGIVFTKSYLLE